MCYHDIIAHVTYFNLSTSSSFILRPTLSDKSKYFSLPNWTSCASGEVVRDHIQINSLSLSLTFGSCVSLFPARSKLTRHLRGGVVSVGVVSGSAVMSVE